MFTPDELDRQHTLLTAAARYDELRMRDLLAPRPGDEPDGHAAPPLTKQEALELLALGELLARKAAYGRQLAVRTAREAGASWSQIGAALGTTKQSAWEAHTRWIDEQAGGRGRTGQIGLSAAEAEAARDLAGTPDDR
ncbi:hypothetical protein HNP84_006206 [Thermocatellispora tengchongensis]|uniref:Uncharacterized protein n=1 Tax=Thermocatellispora tengchongensis TaxID=1073253 RepID=A0A840PBU5_9ACTN|nr:hypothetical protein [Thermocatellispora tengchongensis]MBB5136459.1 hypothetical protein [Thermocatellispora tengchongensis]